MGIVICTRVDEEGNERNCLEEGECYGCGVCYEDEEDTLP